MIPWQPRYTLTPAMARRLMEIEAARAVVEQIPLPPAAVSEMRNRARLRSTHYSTRIEGNRLTLAEAEQVLAGRRVPLHGRERDVASTSYRQLIGKLSAIQRQSTMPATDLHSALALLRQALGDPAPRSAHYRGAAYTAPRTSALVSLKSV